jgi:phospholipase/carboxylesterase
MNDPHRKMSVSRLGPELTAARGAAVLLHGRGASAEDILGLAQELYHPDIAYFAPQAANNTWYPYSFLAPIEQNEPWLSSALSKVASVVDLCVSSGIPREKIVVCGFSQGACLATEFVARHPARYGALIAFTGGLIGPPGADLRHPGSLDGMPALLSSGDPDPHVPWSRVQESAQELERMGAEVRMFRYPNRPHAISEPEIRTASQLVLSLF